MQKKDHSKIHVGRRDFLKLHLLQGWQLQFRGRTFHTGS